MKVSKELKKVEGLTNLQRVKVGSLITRDPSAMDYFFTIDPPLKALYVHDNLATHT